MCSFNAVLEINEYEKTLNGLISKYNIEYSKIITNSIHYIVPFS